MIIEFLKKWKDIDSRLARKQFWHGFVSYSLFVLLIYAVVFIGIFSINPDIKYLTDILFPSVWRNLFVTIVTVPLLTAIIRRLNDTGMNKTFIRQYILIYILLTLIPGYIIPFLTFPMYVFVLLLCIFKKNKFGDPDAKPMWEKMK